MITVFRSRLRPEAQDEYEVWATHMSELAAGMPGHLSHKTFVAEDGERVTLAEFESEEARAPWSRQPEHVDAQTKGREDFYLEYRIQVCELRRTHEFSHPGGGEP